MKRLATQGAQNGFTLLELLLSMALTALLLGLLSAGTYTVVSEWQRDTSGLDQKLDEALVLLQLERALLAAFPHSYIDNDSLSRRIYFEGTARELRFVSAVSPQRRTGLTAWRLNSDPQRGIELALTPAFGDNPNDRFESVDLQTLLPGYEAEFRYLWQRNTEEKEWVDSWEGAERLSLPIAVQVKLTPIERNAGPTLDLITPIKSNRHLDIEPRQAVFQ